MKRVLAVMLIGAFSTFFLGFEETSWAVQSAGASQTGPQRDTVVQTLSTLRRGATVEIEQGNETKFYAVIDEIGPDAITVMRDQAGKTLTETIAISDIRSIKAVSVRQVARGHRGLIAGAIAVGVIVALVGVCAAAAASLDVRPVPNGS
jgi:hypothetical protein